jgi:hypothetical protein
MIYGVILCYMFLYGVKWCYMVSYGVIWCYMVIYGVIWCYMMLYADICCYMVLYGPDKRTSGIAVVNMVIFLISEQPVAFQQMISYVDRSSFITDICSKVQQQKNLQRMRGFPTRKIFMHFRVLTWRIQACGFHRLREIRCLELPST